MVERTAVEYVSLLEGLNSTKLVPTSARFFLKLELFQYRYKIGIYVKSAFKKCCVSLVNYSENTENKPAMTSRWNYCLSRHFFVLDSAQPTNVIGRYKNFFSCTAWFEYLFQFNTPSFPYSGRERERDKKWIAYESCTFVIESTCHFQWGGPLFSLKLNPPFQTPACYEMHIPLVCNSF